MRKILGKQPGPTEADTMTSENEPPRPSGYSAKPTLIESIGLDALAGNDLKVISERAIDYVSRYHHVDTYLYLSIRQGKYEVVAARGPHSDRLLGSTYREKETLGVKWAENNDVINLPELKQTALKERSELINDLSELGEKSLLAARIRDGGLLVLADPKENAFTTFDEAAIGSVVLELSYVVRNVGQQERLSSEKRGLQELLKVYGGLSSTDALVETLDEALNSAVKMSGADNGSFLLYDDESKILRVEVAVGHRESIVGREIGLNEGISGWVAGHKKPITVKDFSGSEADVHGVSTGEFAAALAVPVVLDGNLIGVVNLGSANADHDFSDLDLNSLMGMLGQFGVALKVIGERSEWKNLCVQVVKSLVEVMEGRDPYGRGHSAQVSNYASIICRTIGLSEEETEKIVMAGLLHDIGIAAIADGFFSQERPLNSVERLLIRNHPRLGAKAFDQIDQLKEVVPIILHHHENYDGSGYVAGIEKEQIPIGARILAVADAYAAMTADRAYRKAKSKEESICELRSCSGKQFDPDIVEAFCVWLENNSDKELSKAISSDLNAASRQETLKP